LNLILAFTILILLFLTYEAIKKRLSLVEVFAFLLPFKTFNYELGLTLWAYYIPLVLLFFTEVIVRNGRKILFGWPSFFFIFYVCISTILISNFHLDSYVDNVYGSYLRQEGRYIVVLLKFLFFQIGIFFLVSSSIKSEKTLKNVLKYYLKAINILVILGLFQWLVYLIFKVDLFPYKVIEGESHTAITEFLARGIGTLRITSLGGEPKGLAASLCVAIAINIVNYKYQFLSISNSRSKVFLYVLTLILTLSTGGYGLLILFLATLILIRLYRRQFKIRINLKSLVISSLILLIIGFSWQPLTRIVNSRIIERADSFLSEDVDKAIQSFLTENSRYLVLGTGSGNIHNYAYKYIESDYLKLIMKGQIFVSRYGIVKLISENGVIGFLLFALFFFSIWNKKPLIGKNVNGHAFLSDLSLILLFYFIARSGYVEAEFYFILALFYSLIRVQRSTIRV